MKKILILIYKYQINKLSAELKKRMTDSSRWRISEMILQKKEMIKVLRK